MAEVTASMVKELRERTGVGMGKCKEALQEANGDMELAIANLRKAGMASAVKKEGRETKEGVIKSAETADCIALVEVNAETDFVVKNDKFQQFASELAQEIAATKPASLEAFLSSRYSKDSHITIDEYRSLIVQSLGENVKIKRFLILPKSSNVSISVYSHLGGKLVTAVVLSGSNQVEALAKEIAMHVAAESPDYLVPDEIPDSVKENEKEIARAQVKDKPAQIAEKIVEGKIKAFYDQVCLLYQKFIKDHMITIEQLVEKHAKDTGKPLKVERFLRWKIGE